MNNMPNNSHHKQHLLLGLVLAVIFLLPFGRLSELPILVLALWGLVVLLGHGRHLIAQSWFKAFTSVYLCYLSIIIVSAIDSYWAQKSWVVGVASLRFYFAGLAVISLINKQTLKQLGLGVTVVVTLWLFDALVQSILGFNLFGQSSYPGRLTGVFADNVKLGPVLAILMPLVLIQLSSTGVAWRYVLTALMIVVILLSGTRSAWLMLGFILLLYWWQHVRGRRWLLLLKTITLMLVAVVLLWFVSTDFQQRVERSVSVFEGSSSAIDYALADRLPIWQTAINMYMEHPINGVGARAFRVVYADYAAADDVWVAADGGGLHAHHWVLELLAETGTIGLLLMLLLLVITIKQVRAHTQDDLVWPYAVALMAALLPVISLYSLFSSFWSMCLWWLLIMLFAGCKHVKN